jgi:hypothetical protein
MSPARPPEGANSLSEGPHEVCRVPIRMRSVWWTLGAALAFVLASCGEKQQTLDADTKKVDAKPWEASNSPYLAGGWRAGDKTSWDEQMRMRAQAQNEYTRTK